MSKLTMKELGRVFMLKELRGKSVTLQEVSDFLRFKSVNSCNKYLLDMKQRGFLEYDTLNNFHINEVEIFNNIRGDDVWVN